MNLSHIVNSLEAERKQVQSELGRLDAAIAALTGLHTNGSNGIVGASPKVRRTMSAAGRRAVSLAQKASWAKRTLRTPQVRRSLSASCQHPLDEDHGGSEGTMGGMEGEAEEGGLDASDSHSDRPLRQISSGGPSI
jgi:hypothetical protein